jgi:hypothetical protein
MFAQIRVENGSVRLYVLSHVGVTVDDVWVGDSIYTHDSELQEITAPPLISTNHKPPELPLSLFLSAVSSLADPWQRLLTV